MRVTHSDRQDAEALFYLGNRRLESDDRTGAEACFREAVTLVPDFAEALGNLAILLEQREQLDEAESCYRRALAIDPAMISCSSNWGNFLINRKRYPEALQACEHTLALAPARPQAWTHLGVLHASMQHEEEAERCHRKAMALDPDYALARFNLSYVLLRQGRFEEGWECLESRHWLERLAASMPCPRWLGEPLSGKRIIVAQEGGHGDMIQFCRYIPLLKALGAARIGMQCPAVLAPLLHNLEGLDETLPANQPVPSDTWDYWVPILSLPKLFWRQISGIPAALPYLRATPAKRRFWEPQLPHPRWRIGLCWKGNPLFENDADRSLPSLSCLDPILDLPGVHFVSLQKGAGEEEAQRYAEQGKLTHLGSVLQDFSDTAAVIEQLDLVISVDTAVAHLTGALGKPCWLLLPHHLPDWRWQRSGDDSAWYPGVMRLFRQQAENARPQTIQYVRDQLAAFTATRQNTTD